MEYEKLVYKLGSLHTLLRELQIAGLFQGEHTIAYNANGVQCTIHVHIDGTELQMFDTDLKSGLDVRLDILQDE